MNKPLTENEVVELLAQWLESENWTIKKKAHGYEHGNDIEAEKNNVKLIIEAKGAKPNDPRKTHSFDGKQIQTHFGKALIKIMEQMTLNPKAKFGIAQPNTSLIKDTLKDCLPQVKKLNITLYWVNQDGAVLVG